MIECIYNDMLPKLHLHLIDEATIQTTQESLYEILELLKENKISIKQVRYGSTNLEKHFLEITGDQ